MSFRTNETAACISSQRTHVKERGASERRIRVTVFAYYAVAPSVEKKGPSVETNGAQNWRTRMASLAWLPSWCVTQLVCAKV